MAQNAFKEKANDQTKDINLIDLFIFLLKYKLLIISFIILAGIVTPLYLYLSATMTSSTTALPKVSYYSECTISPYNVLEDKVVVESASNRIEKLKIILMNRDLATVALKENRLPMIRHNIWDEKTNSWVTEHAYVWDERSGTPVVAQPNSRIVSEGTATLYIKPQNNILTIGFSSDEKDKTMKMLDRYLSYISDFYRGRDMAMIKAQQSLYQKQLLSAHDPYLKSRLMEKIIESTDRELRANNDRYYGYDMMDSPHVIEVKPQEQTAKKSGTRMYIMMTLLLMMAAFVIALSIAGAMEYLALIKKKDPERFALLLKYLGLRNRNHLL